MNALNQDRAVDRVRDRRDRVEQDGGVAERHGPAKVEGGPGQDPRLGLAIDGDGEAQHEEALVRLQDLCDQVSDDQGVHVELEVPEHTRAVVNDAEATAVVEAEAAVILGPDQVFRMPAVSPSDDVSEFLRHLPGCYFFVGGGAADGTSGMHHSPSFLVEDESLRVGAGVLARGALALATT